MSNVNNRCHACGRPMPPSTRSPRSEYEDAVAYALKTLRSRGRIWEGARPAFESGEYHDAELARMLEDGVIVPSDDPLGGYVLPENRSKSLTPFPSARLKRRNAPTRRRSLPNHQPDT